MRIITLIMLTYLFTVNCIGQSFNQNKNGHLLGKMSKEGLSEAPFDEWFKKGVATYAPETNTINQLKEQLPEYTIKAFMGTWCGDSKREIPKLYAVLDAANFSLDRLTMVGVAREKEVYKQSSGGEHEGLNIHRVPTIIVYKNGEEINRIVESPVVSIEDDLLQITKKAYSSKHLIVTKVDHMINELGLDTFSKKMKRNANKLKKLAVNPYQLNTYANVLFLSNQKDKALAALRLNTLLFPEEDVVFKNLGNKLIEMNKKDEAIKLFKKVTEKNPENQTFQDLLKQISEKS